MATQSQDDFNPYRGEFKGLPLVEVISRAEHLLWENMSLLEREGDLKEKIQDLEARLAVQQRQAGRLREALQSVDQVLLDAVDSKFFEEVTTELGLEQAKTLLEASGCPVLRTRGRILAPVPDDDRLVEHGVVFTVELRVEAESKELAKEYGEDWLEWNLANLTRCGLAIEPHSILVPVDVSCRFKDKGVGYYRQRARVTDAYGEEYTLRFECLGQMPGDPRGAYAETDWMPALDARIAFFHSQQ